MRRRFSTQRHNNLSTSSSGTTGTGALNTCSSTDSSMDALHFSAITTEHGGVIYRHNTVSSGVLATPLPRFAISPCSDLQNNRINSNSQPISMVRRATVGGDERDLHSAYLNNSLVVGNSLAGRETGTELSPVEENASATASSSTHNLSGLLATASQNRPNMLVTSTHSTEQNNKAVNNYQKVSTFMEKRPSTVAHEVVNFFYFMLYYV